MNRDELLTKLAMELREWPESVPVPPDAARHSINGWHWCDFIAAKPVIRKSYFEQVVFVHDWLAERERLINKPEWKDAPEWATHLEQIPEGEWMWLHLDKNEHCEEYRVASCGLVPAGHPWGLTLERRPLNQSPDSRLNDETLSRDAGLKYDSGKPRVGLLSADMPRAIEEVAKVLTYGAEKYAPGNWQHVDNAEQRYLDASWRHELQRAKGESKDSETGLDHLAHKICCDLFRLELAMRACEDGES